MKDSVRRTAVLTVRNIKEILRDPLSLIFMIDLPLFLEVAFYFIFHKLTSQFEMKYLAPGIVVFSQAFLSLFAGLLIALDRASAFLTRLFVSGANSHEFIFGYALALLPVAFIQAILFYLVGGIIDRSVFGAGMILSILLSVFTSLLFIGLGILIGSVCNEKSVGGVASVIIMCQSVLSGMWFPTEGLGEGFIKFMKILPFKNATDLMQNVLNGTDDIFGDILLPLLIVLGYAVLAFFVAVITFKSKMKTK